MSAYRYDIVYKTPSQAVAEDLAAWHDTDAAGRALDPNGPEGHELATVTHEGDEWVCTAATRFETLDDSRGHRDAFFAQLAVAPFVNPNSCVMALRPVA